MGKRAKSPNDPKLSDSGVRRGTCMAGGKAAAEAGAVTHGAVRCSAWLGDWLIGRSVSMISGKKTRKRTTCPEKQQTDEEGDSKRRESAIECGLTIGPRLVNSAVASHESTMLGKEGWERERRPAENAKSEDANDKSSEGRGGHVGSSQGTFWFVA